MPIVSSQPTNTHSPLLSASEPRRYASVEEEEVSVEWNDIDSSKYEILNRSADFSVEFDAHRGYRATQIRWLSRSRPHMRAFHASWICFFTSFFVQFSHAPLLPEIQRSLGLTTSDLWWTNCWMMIGGIPMRFLLGPLCDKYGARSTMITTVALAAIPVAATGLVFDLKNLTIARFFLGAMDSFVPGQYWITCMFVREVGGMAMAIAGGLGATGAGWTQIVTGTILFPLIRYHVGGDSDLAWRLALLFPACLALVVSFYFYHYSDDCPLGNFTEVKRAGLMVSLVIIPENVD